MDTVRFITKQLLKLPEQLVTYFNLIVKGKYPRPFTGSMVPGSGVGGNPNRPAGKFNRREGKGCQNCLTAMP
jgi:hypothetical protein